MLKTKTKTVVLVGILAAMAVALMYVLHFPILPWADYLKIDFSDVPALLASVAVSPYIGLLIMLIKNLLHLPASNSMMYGELSNFLIGGAFVLFAGIASNKMFRNKPMKRKLIPILFLASAVQLVAAMLVNLFVMIPLYPPIAFMKGNPAAMQSYLLGAVLPFNAIKDLLVCVAFYLLYRYIYPLIQKELY